MTTSATKNYSSGSQVPWEALPPETASALRPRLEQTPTR
jgi:hypothetical protein